MVCEGEDCVGSGCLVWATVRLEGAGDGEATDEPESVSGAFIQGSSAEAQFSGGVVSLVTLNPKAGAAGDEGLVGSISSDVSVEGEALFCPDIPSKAGVVPGMVWRKISSDTSTGWGGEEARGVSGWVVLKASTGVLFDNTSWATRFCRSATAFSKACCMVAKSESEPYTIVCERMGRLSPGGRLSRVAVSARGDGDAMCRISAAWISKVSLGSRIGTGSGCVLCSGEVSDAGSTAGEDWVVP